MRRLAFALTLSCFTAWLLPLHASAADRSAQLAAARAASPLALSAALTDARWSTAARVSGFMDASKHAPADFATSAALLYDDQNLYVAFWCAQPVPITANEKTDNSGFGTDDYVGIGIDPSGNGEQAYYFEVSPIGTRDQQASESNRYAPHWSAAAAINPTGWTAMLVIPLNVLRLPAGANQSWRLNFVRGVAIGGRQYTWSYSAGMNIGANFPALVDARYWATLARMHIARARVHLHPRIELYGLNSSGGDRTQFVAPDGSSFSKNPRVAGVDLAYPVTSTISFVGALNPDFSNVEADQQTIAPQVFRRNLNEYRPFFAQGANFINNAATQLAINDPPNQVFYSPSIPTFDRGYKLEGTFGKYQSFGMLDANGINQVTGQAFNDIAFGFKHLLPGKAFGYWTNGVVANHADGRDVTVETGVQARDLRTGWLGALFHQQETGSFVSDASQAQSTYGFIDHQSSNHEALISMRNIGPLYNPIDGFTVIGDLKGPGFFVNEFGAGPRGSGIKNGNVFLFGERYLDRTGAVHRADAGFNANADFNNLFSLHGAMTTTELRTYDGNFFTGYPLYRNPNVQPFNNAFIGLGYREQSPQPIGAQFSWGRFGDFYLQQWNSNTTIPLRQRYTLALEYDGTHERFFSGGLDGQWLRKVALGWSIDKDSNLSMALRTISGNGGFANPGTNLSGSYHRHFHGGDLYLNFGTPAADKSVNRFIIKYVLNSGGESNT